MNDEPPRPSRGTPARLFWVLGLMAGILIGVVAAFGLAGAEPAPATTIANTGPATTIARIASDDALPPAERFGDDVKNDILLENATDEVGSRAVGE